MLVKLRDLRKKHGFKQEEVAKKVGISKQLYSMIEREEVRLTYDRAVIIARLFDTTPDEIFLPETSNINGSNESERTCS